MDVTETEEREYGGEFEERIKEPTETFCKHNVRHSNAPRNAQTIRFLDGI